jgi:very-short-patch-repair endonuclease
MTQHWLHGFRADFYWPELGLVVETDGLRYHRTPARQGRDRVRDQALTAAGLTILRFTHAQVRYAAKHVEATLRRVVRRLAARSTFGDSTGLWRGLIAKRRGSLPGRGSGVGIPRNRV